MISSKRERTESARAREIKGHTLPREDASMVTELQVLLGHFEGPLKIAASNTPLRAQILSDGPESIKTGSTIPPTRVMHDDVDDVTTAKLGLVRNHPSTGRRQT